MRIALDCSRAFLKRRTGIEEYSYRTIQHLRDELKDAQVILYIRADQDVDFVLPENWVVKKLWAPRLWTQVRLSLQILIDRPDVLFVPAHTVPLIHPKKTVVVVHGLEYEFCPQAYSFWERLYMCWSIRFSCMAAERVVCVSENTKRDVMRLYGVEERRISVVYEGYEEAQNVKRKAKNDDGRSERSEEPREAKTSIRKDGALRSAQGDAIPYFLFIGRLEERKNVTRIIEAFEWLKERYDIPHKLVLVGKPGYGYEKVREKLRVSEFKKDIVELGYVSEQEKQKLLLEAGMFVFPTLYEGFGLPVLEAQAAGVPVVTSNISSLPEVAGEGALLVDPENVEEIVEAIQRLVSNVELKNAILQKGRENVKRFSWEKCAKELADILQGK